MIPLHTILQSLNSEQAADVFGILTSAGTCQHTLDCFIREMMLAYHFTHTEATAVCARGITRMLAYKMTSHNR